MFYAGFEQPPPSYLTTFRVERARATFLTCIRLVRTKPGDFANALLTGRQRGEGGPHCYFEIGWEIYEERLQQ